MNNNITNETVKKDKINIEIKPDSNNEKKVVKRKRGRPRKNKDEPKKEKSTKEEKKKENNKEEESKPEIILLKNKNKNIPPYNIEYEGIDIEKYKKSDKVFFYLYCGKCKKQYYDENLYVNHMVFEHFDILKSIKYSYLKKTSREQKYEYYDKIESTKKRIRWNDIKNKRNSELMYPLNESNRNVLNLNEITTMTFYNISNKQYDSIISYLKNININHNILTINKITNIFYILLNLKENYNYVLRYKNYSDYVDDYDYDCDYDCDYDKYGIVVHEAYIYNMDLHYIINYKIKAMIDIIIYIIKNENIKYKYIKNINSLIYTISQLSSHEIIYNNCQNMLINLNNKMIKFFSDDIKLLYNFNKYNSHFDFNYILNNDKITKEQYVENNKNILTS
jgi:hypothetical protein